VSEPPLEGNVPSNLPAVIVELITSAWTIDPALRHSVEQLIQHPAFQLLGILSNIRFCQFEPETIFNVIPNLFKILLFRSKTDVKRL